MNFDYWNSVNPETFLMDDWANESRAWAGQQVAAMLRRGRLSLVEVGPGPGVDYARQFQRDVLDGWLEYTGYEASSTLCDALRKKYPEAMWCNRPLGELPAAVCDVVYAKAVLEHQQTLEPSLSTLLNAARRAVVLIWYRPPTPGLATCDVVDGVYYHTFQAGDVLDVIERSGWQVAEEASFTSGNVGWRLERR